jgi:hypothetical protein
MNADISFDADSFGFDHPADLTVYHRLTPGTGLFVPLSTSPFNPVTGQVSATMNQFGEFILGYPDLADVALPPILHRPESLRIQTNNIIAPRKVEPATIYTVNQELPVYLSWSPKGFARYFDLQIDTDDAFSSPEVDLTFRSDAFHVWTNALSGTTYHWRARSLIESNGLYVAGEWSTGAFQTVAPAIEVVAANGGEFWQRGLDHFIQWNDNIQENVSISLFKNDTFIEDITTNAPSTGAFEWEPGFNLDPGVDYTIRVARIDDAGLFDVSDNHFNIDVPRITSIVASGGSIVMGWEGTSAGVYVERTPGFSPADWTEIAGPIMGSSWTNTPPSGEAVGNYRLRLQ